MESLTHKIERGSGHYLSLTSHIGLVFFFFFPFFKSNFRLHLVFQLSNTIINYNRVIIEIILTCNTRGRHVGTWDIAFSTCDIEENKC